jgi:hypothetical protein
MLQDFVDELFPDLAIEVGEDLEKAYGGGDRGLDQTLGRRLRDILRPRARARALAVELELELARVEGGR